MTKAFGFPELASICVKEAFGKEYRVGLAIHHQDFLSLPAQHYIASNKDLEREWIFALMYLMLWVKE